MDSNSSMEQQFLTKLNEIIEANLHNENFSVSELADKMGIDRVTLFRKAKAVLKKSAGELIREARLNRASDLLRKKTGTVSEIAFEVGFGSVSYFNRCFHEYFGYPPGEILKGQHTTDENQQIEVKGNFLTKKRATKIFYAIPLLVALLVILILIINNRQKENSVKSIAVLPFADYSPVEGQNYIVNGLREEIINKLDLINNLRVVSRTTTDKYEGSGKDIGKIGKELKADYIIEGSGQTVNNETTLRIQLIDVRTDNHIWSHTYPVNVNVDLFSVIIEDVALSVASQLSAKITPSDKKQIQQKSTNNPAAYNYYLQGLAYLSLQEQNRNATYFLNAKKVFENAILIDSTFADAYYKLAKIYIHQLAFTANYNDYNRYNLFLDTGLVLADKALAYKIPNVDLVYQLKADYYQQKDMNNEALVYFEKLWRNKQKDYSYYLSKAKFNNWNDNYYEAISNYLSFYELKPETLMVNQLELMNMCMLFSNVGFPKTALHYADELLKWNSDSLNYLGLVYLIYFFSADFKTAKEKKLLLYSSDTTNIYHLVSLLHIDFYLEDFETALMWAQKLDNMELRINGTQEPDLIKGYLYKINGMTEKAKYNFEGALKKYKDQIKYNIPFVQLHWAYGRIAVVYSILNEKEKAFEYLKLMTKRETVPLIIIPQIRCNAFIENVRNEPEFIEMANELEAKYWKEHERVKKLLISKGMVPD